MSSFKLDKHIESILIEFIRPYYKAKWAKHFARDEIWRLLLTQCMCREEHLETNDKYGELPALKQIGEPGFNALLKNVRPQSINQSTVPIMPEKLEQISSFLRNPNVTFKTRFVLPFYLKRYLSKGKSLAEQQEVRRQLVKLAAGVFDWERASRFLVKSQICMDLLIDYAKLCDKLSTLGMPVTAWSPDQEENWLALEECLFPLAERHKIRLSQIADILLGEAPEKPQQKHQGDKFTNEQMDLLAEMAQKELPDIVDGGVGDKLWACFKEDIEKGFRRYKKRLAEAGLDKDDYFLAARQFFLKKIQTWQKDRAPFAPYFRRYLKIEMNRWVFRRICANADDKEKRLVKHRALISELKGMIKIGKSHQSIDANQIKQAFAEIKRNYCLPGAKAKLISGQIEFDKGKKLSYLPLPRTWLKDLFAKEEVNELASILKGRQREVFIFYFGGEGLTEREIADRLGTSQQNISKIRERAVKNVLEKKFFSNWKINSCIFNRTWRINFAACL